MNDDYLISILSSIRLNLDMSKANKQTVQCLYNLDAPSELDQPPPTNHKTVHFTQATFTFI